MPSTDVTWICCPADVTAGRLRISVVVVPRLVPDGESDTVASFAALRDWPTTITELAWAIDFGGGATGVAATRVGDEPDVGVWRAVVRDDVPVRPTAAADPTARPVVSYPSAATRDRVLGEYAEVAAAEVTGSAPTLAAGTSVFDLGGLSEFQGRVAAELQRTRVAGDPTTRVLAGVDLESVGQAYAFQQPEVPVVSATAAAAPTLDLHQVLTLLGDHPLLLRRLGLLVDLEVPTTALDAKVTTLRLADSVALPATITHHRPLTAVVVGAGADQVGVRTQAGDADPGVWPLDGADFHLEDLDLDGAVRRGVASAGGLAPVSDGSLPSLRNDGIALVQTGRADALEQRFGRTRARRSQGLGDDDVLTAEDLRRGFRVDIGDGDAPFRSLHQRRIRYTVDGGGALPAADQFLEDEGFAQEALTGDTHRWVHERVVTWRGWSLSAARPGAGPPTDQRGRPSSPTLASLHTTITCEVQPGTLPRLRFGHDYRFRLRTVDLAGRSLGLADASTTATAPLTFRRYEPVLPPMVVSGGPAATYPAGESDRRLVIRHAPMSGGFVLLDPPPPTPCERVLLPPRAPVALAEQHGMFDDALGKNGRAVRDARSALVPRSTATLTLPVGDTVPYLADPQAAGVVLSDLPGADGPMTLAFTGDGADAVAPLRLRLETSQSDDGPERVAPSYDEASRTLTVFLAPGERRTIRATSLLRDPDLMALVHEAPARRPPSERWTSRCGCAARSTRW